MPSLNEGLLEKGQWEPAKKDAEPTAVTRASEWVVDLLRPAVLTKPNGREAPMRRTAYLDGLKGFAAFVVYWQHHQLWAHDMEAAGIFENAYGYDDKYYWQALPGFRLMFCGGHYAVVTFFLVSGYVLSAKPLSLIQSGDYMKLSDNLSSALFRRWMRLFLPLFATTFLYMTFFQLVWTGAFPAPQKNWGEEFLEWFKEMKNFSFIFKTGGEPWCTYNFHSWSIPVEFKGSIVVYTSLLAFSRCTRNARLWGEGLLIVYFLYFSDGWFCAAFVAGMALCDLDYLAADDNLPHFLKRFEPYKKYIFYAMLVCSIYLGGVPAQNSNIPQLQSSYGWGYLSYLKPKAMWDYKWFYLFWAATFLMAAIPRIHWLKNFFEGRFCQYLGRIAFALYLVHGPVLWTLADRLYAATGFARETNAITTPGWIGAFPISKAGPLGFEPAFIAPHVILLPVTFWLAELVTKLVDEPSIKFPQWLYQKTLAPAIKL